MKYVIGLLVLIISFVLLYKPVKEWHQMRSLIKIENNERYALINELYPLLSNKIKVGMSKDEVKSIIGLPQNLDNEYVWVWTSKPNATTNSKDWILLSINEEGYFLVFYENRLLAPLLKLAEANPWEIMKQSLDISKEQIYKMIGENPLERNPVVNSS